MRNIFSFDAETNGLWGQPFAIAAIVYKPQHTEGDGSVNVMVETARFIAKLPNSFVTNEWVQENVIPAMYGVEVTHENYDAMLGDFADFYLVNKNDADVICHMGVPVEAHLLREMHRLGFIGDWDGPYPLIDIAGNLHQAGENPTSCDEYVEKHGLAVSNYGTAHNPLYDCEVAAKVYMHLNSPQK